MRHRLQAWIYRLVFLLLIALIVYLFKLLAPLWMPPVVYVGKALIPFLIAAFIAYLLHPIIEKLHHQGLPRGLAVMIIYLLFFGGIGWGMYQAFPLVMQQLKEVNRTAPELFTVYRQWVNSFYEQTADFPEGIHDRFEELLVKLEAWLNRTIESALTKFGSIVNSLLLLAVIPLITFYLLKDFHLIKKFVWYMTYPKWRKPLYEFMKDTDKTLGNYLRGQLLVALIIGALAWIGLSLIKMPYPLLLGIIIGATNIIPYFGPILGAIPAAVIAMTISVKMSLLALAVIALLQLLEGNLLSPLIVGKSLHIHPLFIMLALLIGGEAGGVLGLIFAVPILAVLKTAVIHIHHYLLNR